MSRIWKALFGPEHFERTVEYGVITFVTALAVLAALRHL
jgi:hypothetical protein